MIGVYPVSHQGDLPWWSEFVELIVELGVGTAHNDNVVGQWDVSEWDDDTTGTWSGLEPDWVQTDPCNMVDVSITRGRDRSIDRFGASSAGFTFRDPDGRLSWDSTALDDQLEVRPGREVRVRARIVADGTVVPLWRGWLENINSGFLPSQEPVAQFTAQDSYAQLAHIQPVKVSPVGAGESSDDRVHRLLDEAEWPEAWRDVDAGIITVLATELGKAIADELGLTADSEGGAVFADRDGNIAFRNRDWLRTDPRAIAVQATLGGPDEEVCASDYSVVRSGDDIVNDVQTQRVGGTLQVNTDAASIALYRRRTFSRTDYICEDDTQVDVLGTRILNARSSGQVRMPTVTVVPTDQLAAWRFVCTVDYGWRLRVVYGDEWDRSVIVQGISHRITPGGWETVLRVDDAPPPEIVDVWDDDDLTRGWDVSLWQEVV